MNPPGGISLIIHVFIVILGNIKRGVVYILRRAGIANSRPAKIVRRGTDVLNTTLVERSVAFLMVAMILAMISITVYLSVRGAVGHESNLSFIAGLVKFIKNVL